MASGVTYKNLYGLVVSEIEKRVAFNTRSSYSSQSSKSALTFPFATGDGRSDASTAELVTAIQNLLGEALPSNIISGLEVTATDPISNSVNISSGKGSVAGYLYSLASATSIKIPFDNVTEVFYIVLHRDNILVEKNYHPKKLTIAKIIVPNPGTTIYVQDTKDESWNAYIVNFKEYKLYGYHDQFEEDTIELLRNNISPILADNLIGNIRLSEDLKITNTQGTLELDSTSLKLLSTAGNTLAKFNRNGTFFYDDNGSEVAKFSTSEARVGNIRITKNSVQSGNFVSGALGSGFQILDNGDAEFNNIVARGKLSTSVFEKDTISSVGGNLLVSDSDILDADMTVEDSSTLTISGDTTFSVGDILRIKDGTDDEWFEVTNISSAPIYTVTRDKAGLYNSDRNPNWKKGTAVINYGSSGEGLIYMTSSESNSPYFSVVTHAGSPWSTLTTRVKIGNLNGFLDYVTALYGIGIGDANDYLTYDPTNGLRIKGNVTITGGSIPLTTFKQSTIEDGIPTSLVAGDLWINTDSGRLYRAAIVGANEILTGEWEEQQTNIGSSPDIDAGLYMSADYMGYFSGSEWTTYIQNNGNFRFGTDISGDTSNYICWNGSTLTVRGTLNADDIIAGTLTLTAGMCISSSSLESGAAQNKTVFDAYGIKSYDNNNNLKLEICDGHIEAQDITLKDPLCSSCYSFLDAGRLKFHDPLGDVPYVTRICSGTAATGGKVTLLGWNNSPEITVGIKELQSYNSSQSSSCQKWYVYNDAPIYFCTSSINYGYCFLVHACLVTAESTGAESVKSAAMDACVLTGTGVCSTKVRMKFQLWCNNAAPSNFYYGTICYAICYRCNGCGSWEGACCYCFAQPHASQVQMQTTTDHCVTLALPSSQCWQLMAHCVSLAWTDSGICATGSVWCCYSCVVTASNCTFYNCCVNGTCTYTVSFSGLPGGTVYCSQLSYCVWDGWLYHGRSGGTYTQTVGYPEAYVCSCGLSCCLPSDAYYYTCIHSETLNFPGLYTNNQSTAISSFDFTTWTGCGGNYGVNATRSCVLACICCISQTICYCCICYTGAAACCNFECLHSLTDSYSATCLLDPAGCINWLAISYN